MNDMRETAASRFCLLAKRRETLLRVSASPLRKVSPRFFQTTSERVRAMLVPLQWIIPNML